MKQENEKKPKKEVSLFAAVLLFVVVCAAIAIQKGVLNGDMGSMFFMLWVVVIPFGLFYGHTSAEMEKAAIDFTCKALPAIFVLLAAGALIGAWIAAGTTPTLIYFGLKFINPKIFLVTAMLLCSLVSLACGTSNGTAGTAGVALIGIGNSMGIPSPITAGAIICGSYFGDKMSPMSDTTILASSIAEVNIFKHIRHMVYDQIPGYIISIIFFLVIGLQYGGSVDSPETIALMNGLQENFHLDLIALLPLIVTALLLIFKQSALMSILGGAVSGILVAIFYQGMGASEGFGVFYNGFSLATENETLSTLLNRGGINSMWSLAGITLFGFTIAGMLDYLQVINRIAEVVTKRIHSITALSFITILFGFIGNAIAFSQNFAIVMTGTLMAPMYKKYNLQPMNCSRDLEAGGTYGCMFIPWNANTVFTCGVLGVSVTGFIPYIPLLYLTPITVLIFTLIKYKTDKIYDDVGYVDVTERLAADPVRQHEISGIE